MKPEKPGGKAPKKPKSPKKPTMLKYSKGGTVRGMGAAKKGGSFSGCY